MTLAQFTAALGRELSPTPWRAGTTAALTLGVLLVVTIMLTFHMPMLAIGPYLVLLGTQRDLFSTRIAFIALLIVAALASLVLTAVTCIAWDDAWLRVPLFGLLFYVCYYLMRVLVEPKIIMGALVIVALSSYVFDELPNPNLVFGQIGWLWAMIGTVIASILLAQALFPPLPLRDLARADMRMYLEGVERDLLQTASGQTMPGLGEPSALHRLLGTLKRAVAARELTPKQAQNSAILAKGVDKIMQAALSMSGNAAQAQGALLSDVARQVGEWRCHILETRAEGGGAPAGPDAPPGNSGGPSPLRAALHGLESAWRRALADPTPPPRPVTHLVAPDFASNPEYHDFALRASLATLSCYLFMTAVHWPGIHTCMVTCVITALASAEARVHKQRLRIIGGLLGGTFAFGSALFVIPHVHGFAPFLLLLAAGTWIGGWMAQGSERYSYIGLQFTLALYLMLLQSTHPVTEVSTIRDRWVGILVGTLAMWMVFRWQRKIPVHEAAPAVPAAA